MRTTSGGIVRHYIDHVRLNTAWLRLRPGGRDMKQHFTRPQYNMSFCDSSRGMEDGRQRSIHQPCGSERRR
jgi:hypothetical protein